jgi:uncharacterized MAPEG superfamily protein
MPGTNYSIYTIPVAWMLAQATTTRGTLKSLGYGHNVYPLEDLDKVSSHLPAAQVARLKRQQAAHHDGFENFPLFAAAMIVGNEAGLSAEALNAVGFGYLLSRGLYTWCYINIQTEEASYWRYILGLAVS